MGAGEAHVDVEIGSQCLDRFLALRQHLQQFEPFRAADRFADTGDLLVQKILYSSVFHGNNLIIVRLFVKILRFVDRCSWSGRRPAQRAQEKSLCSATAFCRISTCIRCDGQPGPVSSSHRKPVIA
nr:G254 [uncultured bacterium]